MTVERYQQVKDAGFTHVMPNCVVSGTIEENRRVLDTAEEVGLRAFVHDLSLPIGVPDDAARRRLREIADLIARRIQPLDCAAIVPAGAAIHAHGKAYG